MKRSLLLYGILALVTIALAGCGAGSMSSNPQGGGATQAAVFMTGEDAPVSSVVAFNITIDKITLNNGSNTVTALSAPVAVDFGRLVGLRSLLGFNTIPAGTDTSAIVTFEATSPAPAINYIDLTTTPPSIGTAAGVLSSSGYGLLPQRKTAGGGKQRPGRLAHGFQSAEVSGP
jgi:hypothetical protein